MIYSVKIPDSMGGGINQNQLTTLPGNGVRVRTAQGFSFGVRVRVLHAIDAMPTRPETRRRSSRATPPSTARPRSPRTSGSPSSSRSAPRTTSSRRTSAPGSRAAPRARRARSTSASTCRASTISVTPYHYTPSDDDARPLPRKTYTRMSTCPSSRASSSRRPGAPCCAGSSCR